MSDGGHDDHGGHGGGKRSEFKITIPWQYVLPVLAVGTPLLIYLAPDIAAFIVTIIGFLSPLWLPALLIWIGLPLWLTFVRSHFVMSIPYSTIELKPGPETPRSARPMELVFYALYHRTDVTPLSEYLLGHVRVPWGFEVMAHAGSVRFFVHLPTAHREAVESRIRSEYRDIDIDQVRDYSREIAFDPYSMGLFMREFHLKKPDPYPLKTYTQREDGKGKGDTFMELLEGTLDIGETEHLLISFIVRPHQRERKLFRDSTDSLHEDAQREIVSLLGPKGDVTAVPEQTRKTITAIETALKKPSFDCGVRALYLAPRKDVKEDIEQRLENLLARFDDPHLNGFQAYDPVKNIGWPLADVFNAIPSLKNLYFLQLYRRRAFFAPPYYGTPFVLNTEELATMFHIPHYARASALSSLRGVRLEPPENLPV